MFDLEPSPRPERGAPACSPFAAPPGTTPPVEEVVLAELVDAPPRLWPTFAVVLVAIGGAVVVSAMTIGIMAAAQGGTELVRDGVRSHDWLRGFIATKTGLALMIVPGQLVFGGVALVAAAFSHQRPVDRLGLRQGSFSWPTWPLFLLGTPVIGMVMAQILARVVSEPSEQMKLLENLFAAHAADSPLLLLLLISLLPGVVEELLFRGFLQRRLLTRLPAAVSIGITAAFFAAAHMDPLHAISVLPLGVWLGIVAWRADSIWPAVFGHMGNNGLAIVMSTVGVPDPQLSLPVLQLMLLSFVGCIVLLIARPKRLRRPAPRRPA